MNQENTIKVKFGRTFSVIAWILAFLITVFTAYFQRVTGPTYPDEGTIMHQGKELSYKFERSGNSDEDLLVTLKTHDPAARGVLLYKRHGTNDDLSRIDMINRGDTLNAFLPKQSALQKLDYQIRLISNNTEINVPEEPVTVRFKDDVPSFWLGLHILAMFGAMLLSTRTGIEAIAGNLNKTKKYTWWTIGFLTFGGFIMGAVVLKYAFDVYWTGFPVGMDMTDNKTLLSWVMWVIAAVMLYKSSRPKLWVVIAAIVTLLIFLVPHSMVA